MNGMQVDAPERMKPSFTLTEDDLPEIKDWNVGKEYDIHLKVKQTSINTGDDMMGPGEKGKISARFQVIEAMPCENCMDEESKSEDTSEPADEPTEAPANPKVVNAVRNKFKKGY